MSNFWKILGTHLGRWHIGGPLSSFIKNVSERFHMRNADDDAYIELRALHPTADDGLMTRLAEESMDVLTSDQHDGGVTLPLNSAVRKWIVVTETGAEADIGDILFDDGTSSGTVLRFLAHPNREINARIVITGNTQTFDVNSTYKWDGSAWIKVGDTTGFVNAIRMIRFAVGFAGTTNSSASLPDGAIAERAHFQVTTAYPGPTTIEVGTAADPNQFLSTTDITPAAAHKYSANIESPEEVVSPAATVLVTLGGAPVSGAGICTVEYSEPLL